MDLWHREADRGPDPAGAAAPNGSSEVTPFHGHPISNVRISIVRKESTDTKNETAVLSEFREQVVALVRGGRTPEDLVREYEPTEPTGAGWRRPIATGRPRRWLDHRREG